MLKFGNSLIKIKPFEGKKTVKMYSMEFNFVTLLILGYISHRESAVSGVVIAGRI